MIQQTHGCRCRGLGDRRSLRRSHPASARQLCGLRGASRRLDGYGTPRPGPGPRRGGSRERQRERRTAGRVVGRLDRTAVLFEDRAADRQAHPQPVGLGGDKRLEDPVGNVGGDPHPAAKGRPPLIDLRGDGLHGRSLRTRAASSGALPPLPRAHLARHATPPQSPSARRASRFFAATHAA